MGVSFNYGFKEVLVGLLTKVFLSPFSGNKTMSPAEHKVMRTERKKKKNLANGELVVIVMVPLQILLFDSWTHESWLWKKEFGILDTNSEHIGPSQELCSSSASYWHQSEAVIESSKAIPLFYLTSHSKEWLGGSDS